MQDLPDEIEQEIDLRHYWGVIRKWWWVLVLGVLGAAAVAYLLSEAPSPLYNATAKLVVQRGGTVGTPSISDVAASKEMARNSADLIKTRPMLEQVIEELSLPYGPGTLSGKIKVSSPRSFIEIQVTDPDPVLAATLANAVARNFVADFMSQQFRQISEFQDSLGEYGIVEDAGLVAAQVTTLTVLRVAEEAIPSYSPSNFGTTSRNVLIASLLGLGLAVMVIAVFAHLDDRIKTPEDLRAAIGVLTLASVIRDRMKNGLVAAALDHETQYSPTSEAYKSLRTNLRFVAPGPEGLKRLLITSASPQDGKTTVAANLAISMAKEGKSVILVDADLRKPSLHQVFNLKNGQGLAQVVLQNTSVEEAMVPTAVEGLRVIPSGVLSNLDATLILGSPEMNRVAGELSRHADLVIYDTPPLLAVTDPMILVPLVDGVLLVVDTQRTKRQAMKHAAESLRRANPAYVGAILNKVTQSDTGGTYYYYYSDDAPEGNGQPNRAGMLKRFPGVSKVLNRGKREANNLR